jgi:hypothetical protein
MRGRDVGNVGSVVPPETVHEPTVSACRADRSVVNRGDRNRAVRCRCWGTLPAGYEIGSGEDVSIGRDREEITPAQGEIVRRRFGTILW